MDRFIELNTVYEITNLILEIVIKQLLGLPIEIGLIIVSAPVLILSYIISREVARQMDTLGVRKKTFS